jgi:tetratricopeptide (TPR) repeat protein
MTKIKQLLNQHGFSQKDIELLSAWIEEEEGFADQATALDTLAQQFSENEEYEKARDFLTEALDLAIDENGPKSIEVAILENNLGRVYDQLNDQEKAHLHYSKALEIAHSISEKDNEFILRVRSNMAMLIMNSGDPESALMQFTEIYEERQKLRGENHSLTLRTMNSIGVCHQLLGNYEEAKKCLQKAYDQQAELLGHDHRNTLVTLSNLTTLATEQGDYNDAINLQQKVYAAYRKTKGKTHVKTIQAGLALANVYGLNNKYEEAKSCYAEIITGLIQAFGAQNPKTLYAQYQLALLNMQHNAPTVEDYLAYSGYHLYRGNEALAKEDFIGTDYFFNEVIAIGEHIPPEKRTDYFSALRALGDMSFRQKHYPEAVNYFSQLEDFGKNAMGEGSRAHLEFLTLKSYAQLKANDKEEAWNNLVFLNQHHDKTMDFHPDIISDVYQKMLVYFQDYQKMIEHYESYAIDANDLFKEVGEMALDLMKADAHSPESFEKAEKMLEKAEKLNNAYGLLQPIVYRVKAMLHYQLEEWEKAETTLKKGLEYLARWEHEYTLDSLEYRIELGNIYIRFENYAKALEYFEQAARVIDLYEDIDSADIVDVYSSLALMHYELSVTQYMAYHQNEAKKYIDKAIPIAEKRSDLDPEMLENLKNLKAVLNP